MSHESIDRPLCPLCPSNKLTILRDRAAMLSAVRSFFKERSVNEVDCPIISASASVDAHIDLIPAVDAAGQMRYLHSSPEYGMKRLLAEGIGDIYQLSHVFRQGEYGRKHNPEFMMAEWYRVGASFDALMAETVDFVRLFLGDLPSSTISYRQAFKEIAGIDYLHASSQDLFNFLMSREIDIPESLAEEGKDALLNIILGTLIEPHLGKNEILVLAYYPSSQAALAQTRMHHDEPVAERFEIYYQGLELANGYHELANADEQRTRFIAANAERVKMGKLPLPIDENFLQSLQKGLPDCCGVAVGFDRLMMVRHRTSRIANVIPFDWESA